MGKGIQKSIKWGLPAALMIAFIAATFYDLQISRALMNETNFFGQLMEDITYLPFTFVLAFSGCIALGTCKKGKSAKEIIILVLCVLYYAICAVVGGLLLLDYFPAWILFFHAFVVIGLTVFAFKIKEEKKKAWQTIALICGITIILSSAAIEGLKLVWGRVRPRSIDETATLFTRWYSINGKTFLSAVAAREEIKSFPSGHSQLGATVIVFTLLPLVYQKLQDKDFLLWCLCIAWGGLVMLARVIVGAHFPTDAMAGFGITMIIYVITRRLVLKRSPAL